MHPETQFANANGLTIAYEAFGDPAAPPILLVAGLAVQMLVWPEDMCEQLADRGFYVIRFDNRDMGLSTHLEDGRDLGTIDILRRRGPYAIADMAADTAALIETLALGPVHLVGVSMGGFISQTVAIAHPDLVRSLTLIMTSTGSRRVGRPRRDVALRVARRTTTLDRAAAVAGALATFRVIGSPGYPFDEELITDIAGRSYDRNFDNPGRRRQLAAVVAQPDRTSDLKKLTMPTLVMHGLDDPVISPSGGLAIARAIPGARFIGFSGMGHDLPRPLWPQVIDEVVLLATQAK